MDSNKEAILPPNRVIFHEIATLSHSSLVPSTLTQMLKQKVEKFMTTKIFCGCIGRRNIPLRQKQIHATQTIFGITSPQSTRNKLIATYKGI